MLHIRKNLLKAFVLLALTSGLLNAQAEEKQSITVGFNPTTGLFQQLLTKRPAAQDVRTTHNVPLLNKQVEVNWSQLGNGGMALASLFCNYRVIRHDDTLDTAKYSDEKIIRSKILISPIIAVSAFIFSYKYAIGEQIFRIVNQQEETSSQEA